ncbi:hypothetical protein [Gilvimarinus agarilyticus]|uniref:hypothetical protein n=1 Tax=Gilvimarinus agarilyticus TaxID=679259 RepID=UPI0005A0869E|nr:hypothetical protein [Gilvimarinus agarilyticus]
MRKKLLPLAMLAATAPRRAQPDPIATQNLIQRCARKGITAWLDECDSTEVLDFNIFLDEEPSWSVAMPQNYSLFNGPMSDFLKPKSQEKYTAYELKPQLIYPMQGQAQ